VLVGGICPIIAITFANGAAMWSDGPASGATTVVTMTSDDVETKGVENDKAEAVDAAADDKAGEDFPVSGVTAESVTADADDDMRGGQTEQQRPHRSWMRLAMAGVAAAIFTAALGISALSGWSLWKQRQIDIASQQARQAAIAYARTLTSIDSNNVDENFKQVLDGATGEFKDMYTRSSVQLRQLLIDNKATAHSTVVDSAIQSKSKNQVVVLLMVDQTVTNTDHPDPRVDRSRMKITMDKVDGRWFASKVELP
jgi:Mce-associated membrane protein